MCEYVACQNLFALAFMGAVVIIVVGGAYAMWHLN